MGSIDHFTKFVGMKLVRHLMSLSWDNRKGSQQLILLTLGLQPIHWDSEVTGDR